MKNHCIILALTASISASATLAIAKPSSSKGKVLIVMSSAHELALRDGKTYKTGYYMDEQTYTLSALDAAGYEAVFANPDGTEPSVDEYSLNKMFFNNNERAVADANALVARTAGLKHPKKLSDVIASDYVGIFVPGGFSPMQDLIVDKQLGKILLAFHADGRTTGLICHGPGALLSTLPDPAAFVEAMAAGDLTKASATAGHWPYAGYRLTAFASTEELLAKPQFRGDAKFFVSDALAQAGAHVDRVA